MPKVTVIVPIYNKEAYLAECLQSLLNQTLTDIEIIAINDGSTDSSPSIVGKFAGMDERIIFVNQQNSGLSITRNNGIDMAKGDYVYFLDSDDYLMPNALETLYTYAKENSLDFVTAEAINIYEDGYSEDNQKTDYYMKAHDYSVPRAGIEMMCDTIHNNEYYPSACLVLLRRDFLNQNKLRFVPNILHEDNVFTFQYMLVASKCAHINKQLYIRRVASDSITTMQKTYKHLEGYIKSFYIVLDTIKNRSFTPEETYAVRKVAASIWSNVKKLSHSLPDTELMKLLSVSDLSDRMLYTSIVREHMSYNAADFLVQPIKMTVIVSYKSIDLYYQDCLDSLAAQIEPAADILLLDDKSDAKYSMAINALAETHENVRIFDVSRLSYAEAKNKALYEVETKYVLFADTSMFFEADAFCDMCCSAIARTAEVILTNSDTYIRDEHTFQGDKSPYRYKLEPETNYFTASNAMPQLLKSICKAQNVILWERKFLLDNNARFCNSDISCSDLTFTLPLIMKSERISYTYNSIPYVHLEKNGIFYGTSLRDIIDYWMSLNQLLPENYKSIIEDLLEESIKFELENGNAKLSELAEITEAYKSELIFEKLNYIMTDKSLKKTIAILQNKTKTIEEINLPLVSVIIPVYNAERYIRETITSLKKQTLTEYEVMFIDDGSIDSSKEIIESVIVTDHRFKLFTQKNMFAGVARNNGMARSKGKYLFFMDADDFLEDNALEKCVGYAEKHKTDITVFSARKFDNVTHTASEIPWILKTEGLPKSVFSGYDCPDRIFTFTSPAPWNKLFSAKFIKNSELEFQDTQNANDLFFTMMALALAKRIGVLNEDLINYRINVKTSLQATSSEQPLAFYKALSKLKKNLDECEMMRKYERAFANLAVQNSISNIDKQHRNIAALKTVYNFMTQKGFNALGIQDMGSDYFFSKYAYAQYSLIKTTDCAEYIKLKHIHSAKDDKREVAVPRFFTVKSNAVMLTEEYSAAYRKNINEAFLRGMNEVNASATYKIGRMVTWLPRTIKSFINKLK